MQVFANYLRVGWFSLSMAMHFKNERNKQKQTNKQTNKQTKKKQINMMISIAKTCTYFSIHAPFFSTLSPFSGKRYEEDPGGCGGGQCSGSFCLLDHTRNKKHMCQGLNSLYFHIIGDGHQPNSRGLYTLAHMFVFFCFLLGPYTPNSYSQPSLDAVFVCCPS